MKMIVPEHMRKINKLTHIDKNENRNQDVHQDWGEKWLEK